MTAKKSKGMRGESFSIIVVIGHAHSFIFTWYKLRFGLADGYGV